MPQKVLPDDIEKAFQEGMDDGVKAVRRDIGAITNEINSTMEQNEAEKCNYTIKVEAKLKIDKEGQKITVTGCYMAPRANMKETGSKIDLPLTDPNQPELTAVDGTGMPVFDATTDKPDEDTE